MASAEVERPPDAQEDAHVMAARLCSRARFDMSALTGEMMRLRTMLTTNAGSSEPLAPHKPRQQIINGAGSCGTSPSQLRHRLRALSIQPCSLKSEGGATRRMRATSITPPLSHSSSCTDISPGTPPSGGLLRMSMPVSPHHVQSPRGRHYIRRRRRTEPMIWAPGATMTGAQVPSPDDLVDSDLTPQELAVVQAQRKQAIMRKLGVTDTTVYDSFLGTQSSSLVTSPSHSAASLSASFDARWPDPHSASEDTETELLDYGSLDSSSNSQTNFSGSSG